MVLNFPYPYKDFIKMQAQLASLIVKLNEGALRVGA
jgi:hypothetical protein